MAARTARALGAFAAALFAAWLVWSGLERAVEHSGVRGVGTTVDALELIDLRLRSLARRPAHEHTLDIVHFGDSNVYDGERGTELQESMTREIQRRRPRLRVRIFPIANPGMNSFSFRFAAPRVAAAHPQAALVAFNPASFSSAWREELAIPEMAALVDARDLVRVLALPVEWIGVGPDQLLLQWITLHAGATKAWRRLARFQTKIRDLRAHIETLYFGGAESRYLDAAQRSSLREILRRRMPDQPTRYSPFGYRRAFGDAGDPATSPDAQHPIFRALAATLHELTSAGIPTIVYALPVNTDDLASEAPEVLDGLRRTLATAAQVAKASGAHWLDLHARHRNAEFGDASSHLRLGEAGSPYDHHAVDLVDALLRVSH